MHSQRRWVWQACSLHCFIEQFKRVTKLVKSTYKYIKSTRDRI